jgi:hypothetical protein
MTRSFFTPGHASTPFSMAHVFKKIHVFFIFSLSLLFSTSKACQCPLTQLSPKECDKYEIIFKGRILRVADCGDKFGEAIFEIQELYKGNATQEFKVLFECNAVCAQKFNPGDEWIIYSRYKQIDNAKMDWCSRSRKFFKIDKEDFYTVTYGNDYYDEVKFLQEKLGIHRVLVEHKSQIDNRNVRPDTTQTIIILICSLVAIVLFYFLFNKFFR